MAKITMVYACLLSVMAIPTVNAADGEFDLGFGIGGQVMTGEIDVVDEPFTSQSVIARTTGGVLFYGQTPFTVRQYTAAGDPDVAFGTNGVTQAPNIGQNAKSEGVMAVGADGMIYASASTEITQGVVVCKFTAQGQLALFTGTQTSCTSIANFATPFIPVSMAVDAGGGLLMLDFYGKLMRFLPSGTVDTAFSPPNGLFTLPPFNGIDPDEFVNAHDLTLDAAGSIYVVGTNQNQVIGRAYATKLRVDANTKAVSFDLSFNAGAPLEVACGGNPAMGCALKSVDASTGRLIVTGTHAFIPFLARLNSTSGQQILPPADVPLPNDATSANIRGAALQYNGKLLIVGTTSHPSLPSNLAWVARVNLNCSAAALDTANFSPPTGSVSFTFLPDAMSEADHLAIGQNRLYVVGNDQNGPRSVNIVALSNAEAHLDRIFADGFEGCN